MNQHTHEGVKCLALYVWIGQKSKTITWSPKNGSGSNGAITELLKGQDSWPLHSVLKHHGDLHWPFLLYCHHLQTAIVWAATFDYVAATYVAASSKLTS